MKKAMLALCFLLTVGIATSFAGAKDSRLKQVRDRFSYFNAYAMKDLPKMGPEKQKKLQGILQDFNDEFTKDQKIIYQDVDPKHPDITKAKDITPDQQKSLNQIMDRGFKLLGMDPKTAK